MSKPHPVPVKRSSMISLAEQPKDLKAEPECDGCHWCLPKVHRNKPEPVEAIPAGHTIVIRCEMSSWDGEDDNYTMWTRAFGSYESASKAIMEEFSKNNYERNYDKHDLNYKKYEKRKPSLAWSCYEFSPAALLAELSEDSEVYCNLYGDYGMECCCSSPRLHIALCKIE